MKYRELKEAFTGPDNESMLKKEATNNRLCQINSKHINGRGILEYSESGTDEFGIYIEDGSKFISITFKFEDIKELKFSKVLIGIKL